MPQFCRELYLSFLLHKYKQCFYCLMPKYSSVSFSTLLLCRILDSICHGHMVAGLSRKKESYSLPMWLCKAERNSLCAASFSEISWTCPVQLFHEEILLRMLAHMCVFAASYRRCLMFCLFLGSFTIASDLAHTWHQVTQGDSWEWLILEKLHKVKAVSKKDSQLAWVPASTGQLPLVTVNGGTCIT